MKKKLRLYSYHIVGLAMSLSLFSLTVNAQNTWVKKTAPPTPFTARNACSGFSIGAKGYFGMGNDGSDKKDFYEYNSANDTWTKKADFAGGVREAQVSFSIGTKGYVGLGDSALKAKADFWEYDPANDKWTRKADFPGGTRTTAMGFSVGSKGYVGCGDNNGTLYKDFYEYDPANDKWTKKADFPGTARADGCGFGIGTKGYIGIGEGPVGTNNKDFYEYDPAGDTWSKKADFTGGVRTTATGFSLNGKGYFGAGDDGTNLHNDFWAWDPSTNLWAQITVFIGTKRSDMIGFAIGGKGYAGNGNQCGASCYINDWYEYTPAGSTAVNNIEAKKNINVFPNPSNGNLNVYCETLNDATTLNIVDALGRKVASYELPRSTSPLPVDASNLNEGIYYYQVLSNNLIEGGKLMIVK